MSKAISGEDGKKRTPESIAAILDPFLPNGGAFELGVILDKV